MSNQRTMEVLSYGFSRPVDLLGKLEREGEKLTDSPHPDDIFDFIVTAAVLGEWIKKYYKTGKDEGETFMPQKGNRNAPWKIPQCFADWITDTSCFPNKHYTMEREVGNVLSICAHTCNASKHFEWGDNEAIESIGEEPVIDDWYKYFFTATEPDLYISYLGENYGLKQIRDILIQFYKGLIPYLDGLQRKSEES